MAINFPSNPSNEDTYSYNGVTYVYNSTTDQWIVQGTGSSDLYVLKTGDTMTGKLTGTTADFSGNVETKDLRSADATVDTLTSNGLVTGAAGTFSGTVTAGGVETQGKGIIESTGWVAIGNGNYHRYIKFADGTLICSLRNTGTQTSAGAIWQYPVAFTSTPSVVMGGCRTITDGQGEGYGVLCPSSNSAITTTQVQFTGVKISGYGANIRHYGITATGSWN